MIEWLRRAAADPVVEVAGRTLPIVIRRHPRARRLTMRLAPRGDELRITMPTWGRTKEAVSFAEQRRAWIAAQLARVPAPATIASGSSIGFRGETLRIAWSPAARRTPQRDGGTLHLGGPAERIEARVQRWLEGELLALLAEDLACYCARAAQPVPALALSRARRRWGSCAARGGAATIRINWRLAMAPDHVRRSVVAHEVAHLTHFDHSPAFHAHLVQLFDGDLAAADLWLKREGPGLYAQFA